MSEWRHFRSVRRFFDRSAPRYEEVASVQTRTARDLLERLTLAEEPLRILDAGCGSGILTRMLLDRFPRSRVDALDVSERMLEVARSRTPSDRVRWIQSDFAHYTPSLTYPLIVSNASLHWAPNLEEAIRNLAECLAPGGLLAVSLMVRGTLRELKACLQMVVAGKPPPGDLPEIEEVLLATDQSGLVREACGTYEVIQRYGSAMEVLHTLHVQGLTGGTRFRPSAPLVRSELSALMREYDRIFAHPDGGVTATYAVGWVCARRPT